jgi:hypothetical protein
VTRALRDLVSSTPRRLLTLSAIGCALAGSLLCAGGCNTVDPGPNFVVPPASFDANFFYCHVEPEVIFANSCGPGDPSKGDKPNGCHFNASQVSGMALIDHPMVDCGGGDVPLDPTQTGTGGPAEANFEAVSLEMNTDYTTAPLYVRPTGHNHPRQIFPPDPTNATVMVIAEWAQK